MTGESNEYHQTNFLRRPMPGWLAATIVGAFLGGSGTYQVMRAVGYDLPDLTNTNAMGVDFAEMRARMEETMRQTIMRMMPMMPGGIASEQQSLTALVGKLDLMSNGLHIELQPEQSEKLALALAKLDQAEQMTREEAHAHIDAIQKLLTEEQNAALAAIELPRGGPSGSRGMRGSGDASPEQGVMSRAGADFPPGMMGSSDTMGSGGPPSNDNPFQQDTNQKQLHDFLDRLRQPMVESFDATEGSGTAGTPDTTNATTSP